MDISIAEPFGHVRRLWIYAALMLGSFVTPSPAQDYSLTAERRILEAAVSGNQQRADFSHERDDKARTVRSSVIENLLLTGRYKHQKLSRLGFWVKNAIFEGALDLGSVTVPVTIHWQNCIFRDKATFSSAHFSTLLDLSGSSFTDVVFNSTVVDDSLILNNVTVTGIAEFYHLGVKRELFARASKFQSAQFGQANVEGQMLFGEGDQRPAASFEDSLSLRDVKTRQLDLQNVVVKCALDLSHANVQTVVNLSVLGPCPAQEKCLPENVQVEGLSYGDLEPGAPGNLRDLISHAGHFSARSYTQLEEYYRTHGEPAEADKTFIDMRQKERNLMWDHWKESPWEVLRLAPWLWSWSLYILVGYGRYPQNALYFSLLFVMLGTWVFWSEDCLEPRKKDEKAPSYHPLLYSFDLLTPFINLQLADYWSPKKDWRQIYAHLHRIIGWILVPIGIAAITGIIK